ncbi:MAG TPA: glycoside hydrolase family 88 protein [Candidatus Limiplasma sp.]|nr:glycoside hydrolase family 88 protein [Candidatus Limiplasma sp.]HRX08328.1 glycoside hydrolase family 88 protein [Candidatus Limiplasma sp.]
MRSWAQETFDQFAKKYERSALLAARQDIIPYKSNGGLWAGPPYEGDAWWTGGFWPGLMWQLFHATGQDVFRAEALRVETRLTRELCDFERLHHDVGFMYLLSCGGNWVFNGDADAKRKLLHAATLLAGRFNLAGSYIRAWNEDKAGWAIIDSMMNLSLLFWASRETGDPRFWQIAVSHADMALNAFVRADGSCNHIVIFDPHTGKVLKTPAGQGYAEGSSWSRGQAWAMYGYVLSYMSTNLARYLDAACRIADYFHKNIRPDGLTDCDFRQPKDEERIDNIAAACASCALIELSRIPNVANAKAYLDAAVRMLKALDTLCADYTDASAGVLQRCTAAYHDDGAGTHINIVYGDYFYAEALAKLQGSDPMLWMCEKPETL